MSFPLVGKEKLSHFNEANANANANANSLRSSGDEHSWEII